ncbi:hypothetical protein FRACYDRAFT_254262 [Fragilariopsis cylindrus CCMP1102]|uniref:Uncharacterized protein n=1 Tax=Fragilariopsis cylindrus CCMP1102 TaxID=635003 RepID=A0A1E7EL00_9STRA|nr:hypothetical protein FRACYDRAFT_254262 [Fragilariopsis cylindrus CCMP1102]|eukprot:OEU06578.1 hypothetical protein FRACYDRAFT_254262 [Fragilariopsis cylindrus CCMP1102]
MISRSKLLDVSDLNTYFTSSLFLLFGLDNGGNNGGTAGTGNDAIITDEDNSIISKYLVIVYQRIRSSNTVQLLFEFITTIYLGINSNSNDDDGAAAGGSGSIVLSPAAHLLGFGYKTTATTTNTTKVESNSNNVISSTQRRRHRRRRRRQLVQIISYAFLRIVLPKLYEIMKRKGIDYINNKEEEEEEGEEDVSSSFSSPLTLQLSQEHQEKKEVKKEDDVKVIRTTKLLQQISWNRKKLIIQKIIQSIDTTVPIIRLLLLLSCWKQNQNTNTNQHGGNVSMYLSGLSYNTASATSANTMSSSPLPIASSTLFVLYAHRRWFHREFVDLVWNRIGRSLITTSNEINEMIIPFYQKQKQYLLFLYKQKILSRYYKNKIRSE